MPAADQGTDEATRLLAGLADRGLTIATAESLTGGLLCSTLVDVSGASAVVRGGVIAYAASVKVALLGVDPELLAAHGTVHREVAEGMARGVRSLVSSDVGVATTGVAGPEPADGQPVGTVYIAVATADDVSVERLELTGRRRDIREQTVVASLRLVSRMCLSDPTGNVASTAPVESRASSRT